MRPAIISLEKRARRCLFTKVREVRSLECVLVLNELLSHVQFKRAWGSRNSLAPSPGDLTSGTAQFRSANTAGKHASCRLSALLPFQCLSLKRARWPLEVSGLHLWLSNSSQKRILLFLIEKFRDFSHQTNSNHTPPWITYTVARMRTYVYPGAGEEAGMSPQCCKPHWLTVGRGPKKKDKWKQGRPREQMITTEWHGA